MGYVQYTHCVTRDEYEVMGWESFIGPALGVVAAVVIGILTVPGVGVLVGLVAGIWAFEKVCAYLLGGKLICLAHDQCAIGRVVQIEPVGYGKDGFEEIDNDFAVNLLLAPHTTNADRATIAGDGLQGELIAQKSPETDGLDFTGYDTNHGITIPVLHTEFEGSRIRDFCDAILRDRHRARGRHRHRLVTRWLVQRT
jgi:hypothetical protein